VASSRERLEDWDDWQACRCGEGLGDAGDVEGGVRTGVWDAGRVTGERIELCKTRRALLRLTPVTPVFGLRAGFPPSTPTYLGSWDIVGFPSYSLRSNLIRTTENHAI
jgi:hypothetical protein